ncbi:MAG: ACT domain-containing protein [Phototrophicaceae bacterium]
MQLKRLAQKFGILKLTPPQAFPEWLGQAEVFFIARTSDEYSIMCPQAIIPDGIAYSADYYCLRADGDLAFDEVGVVARLSKPLADAQISLFLVSTHDRDYVFVHEDDLQQALTIYCQHGVSIPSESDTN